MISVSVGNGQSYTGWSFPVSQSRYTIKRRCRVLPLLGFETEVVRLNEPSGELYALTTGYAEAADTRSERTGRPGSSTSLTVHEWPVTTLSILSYLCSGCSVERLLNPLESDCPRELEITLYIKHSDRPSTDELLGVAEQRARNPHQSRSPWTHLHRPMNIPERYHVRCSGCSASQLIRVRGCPT
jgi:hypothetical protein